MDDCIKSVGDAYWTFSSDNRLQYIPSSGPAQCLSVNLEDRMQVTLRECLTDHPSSLDHSLLLKEQQLYRIENDAVEILVKELSE